jgi:hypothetical protein
MYEFISSLLFVYRNVFELEIEFLKAIFYILQLYFLFIYKHFRFKPLKKEKKSIEYKENCYLPI